MRKLLLSMSCLFFMAGLVIAAEVTLVKYDKDKKEVTVKDDKGKEHTYKITDKTTFSFATKDGGTKELPAEQVEKMLTNEKFEKAIESGNVKWDITTDGNKIKTAKMKFGKKKQ
jgi:hypothetical protein